MQSAALLRRAGAATRAPVTSTSRPSARRASAPVRASAAPAGDDLGFKTMRAGIKVR